MLYGGLMLMVGVTIGALTYALTVGFDPAVWPIFVFIGLGAVGLAMIMESETRRIG